MSDLTQGQDVSDNELFQAALDTTLEKFENPVLDEPKIEKPEVKADPKAPELKPDPKEPEHREAVPAWRLREESEARRRLEQEVADLRAQRTQGAQKAPPPPTVLFENPTQFVQEQFAPMMRQIQENAQRDRETMSQNFAIMQHGRETVFAAKTALEQGIRMGDPTTKAVLDAAIGSPDPYGVITNWHKEREAIKAMGGGDLEAFKQKLLDEALNNPDYRKRVVEARTAPLRFLAATMSTVPLHRKSPTFHRLPTLAPVAGMKEIPNRQTTNCFGKPYQPSGVEC